VATRSDSNLRLHHAWPRTPCDKVVRTTYRCESFFKRNLNAQTPNTRSTIPFLTALFLLNARARIRLRTEVRPNQGRGKLWMPLTY
jgi:hypothetical protein